MGLDLNTQLISDTFDGLIKTNNGDILTDTPTALSDGRGNDSSIAIANAGFGVTITGSLIVDGRTILSEIDTAQSDIVAIEAKTDFITVTQAVNLDTMEADILNAKTKTDFITITQAVDLDTVESDLNAAQVDIIAIEAKTDFITITQAVDLDQVESDATAAKEKTDFLTVSQAVDLDTLESDVDTAKADIIAIELKTDFITVTQAVDLDTMESDILSAKTKTDFITVTQAVNLDTIESDLATAQSDITAIEAKTDFITITQAVDLDTVESDATAAKAKTDFLTVTQAVDLDTLESDVATAQSDITAIETKTDFITVTQAVNLDTMESDIADAKGKTDFITITQAVDLDTVESDLAAATSKLAGIEDGADVTDATNVAAAGALMSGTAVLGDLADVTVPTPTDGQVLTYDTVNGWNAEDPVGAVDSVNGQTGVVVIDADDIDDAATTNKFTTQAEINKLAGIEAGAEVNTVDSVNGATGVVVLETSDLDDVNPTAPTEGQVLRYDSASGLYVPTTLSSDAPVDSVNGQTGAVVLDADDISDATTTNKFTTAADISKLAGIEAGADVTDAANVTTALGTISVTAHSDVTDAGSGAIITSAERTKIGHITVTQAVDLDTIESDLNTAKSDIIAIEAKTDFITVTQAVDLDTMESNIATNASDISTLQTDKYDKTGGTISGNVTVTGDFSSGFLFTFLDEVTQPLPTFTDTGLNEIQRFNFSNIPNDGTITFDYDGQVTLNFPWDDNAADLKLAFESLSNITEVDVSGSFADQFFEIEFTGGVLVDGLQPKSEITIIQNDLDQTGVPTQVNGAVIPPIEPITVQQGKFPASNLRLGVSPVTITTTLISAGEPRGPEKCLDIDADNCGVLGLGVIDGFEVGIDTNGYANTVVEMQFPNTTLPIDSGQERAGVDGDFIRVLGYAQDIISQLKVSEHPTNKKRLIISSSDVSLPTGVTLTQELENLILDFDGAEVDFVLGKVFKPDGVTDLGIDFAPIIPAATQFRWASLTISAGDILANRKIEGQVLVSFGIEDGATRDAAPRASYSCGKPLAQIALEGDIGLQEITRVITTRDQFESLEQRYFIIHDSVGSVAIWFDVSGAASEPAHGANRSLEVTIPENANPNTVASAIQVVVDADPEFSATVSTNRLEITAATIGPRTDADSGTTDFDITVLQQGRDTDSTGLVDLTNESIYQLGINGGTTDSGSSSGSSNLRNDLVFQLKDGPFRYLYQSVFSICRDIQIASSTGRFRKELDAWSLLSGEELVTNNMVNSSYDGLEVGTGSITVRYKDLIDDAATYEVSLNGGIDYQSVVLERVGQGNTFVGDFEIDFDAITLDDLYTYDFSNADDNIVLNNTDASEVTQEFTTTASNLLKQVELRLFKNNSPIGFYGIDIVKDSGGVPSTDINDVIFSSPRKSISLLSAGSNTVIFDVPTNLLEDATKYHIRVVTDAIYKGSFSISDFISVEADGSSPSIPVAQLHDGAGIYTPSTRAAVFAIRGRGLLDFRLRITSSQDSLIEGFGVFYGLTDSVENSIFAPSKPIQNFTFSGDDNVTEITVSTFNVDADTIAVNDVDTGQLWSFPAFTVTGNTLQFPSGTFERLGETIRLKVFSLYM